MTLLWGQLKLFWYSSVESIKSLIYAFNTDLMQKIGI